MGDLEESFVHKQMTIKHMEEELNELALRLLKEAEEKKESDRLAAEAFEAQLLGIAEGDAFAIKDPSGISAEGEAEEKSSATIEGRDAQEDASKFDAESEVNGIEETKGENIYVKKEEDESGSKGSHKLAKSNTIVWTVRSGRNTSWRTQRWYLRPLLRPQSSP